MHIFPSRSVFILMGCLLVSTNVSASSTTLKSSIHTFLKDRGGAACLGALAGLPTSIAVLGCVEFFLKMRKNSSPLPTTLIATTVYLTVAACTTFAAHNGYVWLSDYLQKPTINDKNDALNTTSSF